MHYSDSTINTDELFHVSMEVFAFCKLVLFLHIRSNPVGLGSRAGRSLRESRTQNTFNTLG